MVTGDGEQGAVEGRRVADALEERWLDRYVGLRDSDAECTCVNCRPREVDLVRAWGWIAAAGLGALVWFGAVMWAVSG